MYVRWILFSCRFVSKQIINMQQYTVIDWVLGQHMTCWTWRWNVAKDRMPRATFLYKIQQIIRCPNSRKNLKCHVLNSRSYAVEDKRCRLWSTLLPSFFSIAWENWGLKFCSVLKVQTQELNVKSRKLDIFV